MMQMDCPPRGLWVDPPGARPSFGTICPAINADEPRRCCSWAAPHTIPSDDTPCIPRAPTLNFCILFIPSGSCSHLASGQSRDSHVAPRARTVNTQACGFGFFRASGVVWVHYNLHRQVLALWCTPYCDLIDSSSSKR